MKLRLAIFFIFLAMNNVYAKTGFSKIDGAVLKKECSSALKSMREEYPRTPEAILQASMDLGSCLSYISGVNDALYLNTGINSEIIEDKNAKISSSYCIPDGINEADLIKVLLEFIDDNPQILDVKGSIVILKAFKKKFPCN